LTANSSQISKKESEVGIGQKEAANGA